MDGAQWEHCIVAACQAVMFVGLAWAAAWVVRRALKES